MSGTSLWSEISLSGTPKLSDNQLLGTPKQRIIRLLGTRWLLVKLDLVVGVSGEVKFGFWGHQNYGNFGCLGQEAP